MKDKILIFIITYRASYRVKNVVKKYRLDTLRTKTLRFT